MTIKTTFTYDNPAEFTFNADEIVVSGTDARLKRQPTPVNYTETFDADTGFTYDPAEVEFVGGAIQQIDMLPDVIKAHTFESGVNMDTSSIGDRVGSLTNGATISGGSLNATTAGQNWSMGAVGVSELNLQDEFTIRGDVSINSHNPAETRYFFQAYRTGGFGRTNRVELWYFDEDLVFRVYNSLGSAFVVISKTNFVMNPAQTYTFECFFSRSNNLAGIIVDGVLIATGAATISRTNDTDRFIVGAEGVYIPDAKFDSFHFYQVVPNLGSYPQTPLPLTRYTESRIDFPVQAHARDLLDVGVFSSIFTSTPRFLVNGNYWDGGAWVVSDSSFAQATAYSDMVSNLAFYDITAESTLGLSVVFPDLDVSSLVLTTIIDYLESGDFAQLGTVLNNSKLNISVLNSVVADSTLLGADEVRYNVVVNDLPLWFDPVQTSWVASSGVQAETNTLAELNLNAPTLPISLGAAVQFKAFLISDDATTTPILVSLEVQYIFGIVDGCEPVKCVVYGCILDNTGVPIAGAKVSVNGEDYFYTDSMAVAGADKAALIARSAIGYTNAEGEFSLEVVETTTDGTTVDFVIEYKQNGKTIKKTYTGLTIPIEVSKPLGNLVNP